MFSYKFKGFEGKTFAFCTTATLTAIGAAAAQSVKYWATGLGSGPSHRPKYINTIISKTSKGALEQTTEAPMLLAPVESSLPTHTECVCMFM